MANDNTKPEAIGKRIVRLRKALEWPTAIAFASFVDVSPQQLSNYEKGRARPDIDAGFRICQKTGVTLDWLYRGDVSGLSISLLQLLESPTPPGAERAS